MNMPSRKFTQANSGYRYGFNGKEKDNSTGEGNLDFGARVYDGRLGRWLSVDPLQKKYPDVTPYHFCLDNPILFIDPDGKDVIIKDQSGNKVAVFKNDGTVVITKGMENSAALHSYQAARTYLSKSSSSLQKIEKSTRVLTIQITSGKVAGIGTFTAAANYVDANKDKKMSLAEASTIKFNNSTDLGTIMWNADLATLDGEGNAHSPSGILDHEANHAVHALKDLKKYAQNMATPTSDGTDNVEEQETIAAENQTSKNLNNGDGNYGKRKTHHPRFDRNGNPIDDTYESASPTSFLKKFDLKLEIDSLCYE